MGLLVNRGYFYTYRFLLRWKIWAIISFPIILSPIIICFHSMPEAKCGYVMLLVILYWVFNVIPLPITAILPVALLPALQIMPSDRVSPLYMKDINLFLLAAMACAVGVEYSNLHRRIALKVLLIIGSQPRWLFLGFMATTQFLSMWINNTAATAMMTPIAESVLIEMFPFDNPDDTAEEQLQKRPSNSDLMKQSYNMRNGILLCICGGANIGGTGTMTGTAANLVLSNTVDQAFPDGEVVINYVLWMGFCIPNMILCSICMWLVFQIQFMGCKATFSCSSNVGTEVQQRTKAVIRQKYLELGPMSFHEAAILSIFIFLILLWIFRAPGFMPGWSNWISNEVKIRDSPAAVIALTLMFVFPSTPDWWWSDVKDRTLDFPPPRCLSWEIIHARFTWGVPFILGGGFALAEACKVSGLSKRIGLWLVVLEGTSSIVLCLFVMLFTVFLTTVTSNTATATILLPIMIQLAETMAVAPLFLLLPVTLSSSFSYILPISTPPNAIVFERSRMSMAVMAKTGFWLAVVCILITTVMTTFFAPLVFGFKTDEHPFANKTKS